MAGVEARRAAAPGAGSRSVRRADGCAASRLRPPPPQDLRKSWSLAPNDDDGRLSYESEPFEQWIAFAYSDDGLTVTATDSSGAATVSTYDGYGRLLSRELSAPDSPTIDVAFDYDTDGRLVGVTRTQDGVTVAATSYDYDSATGQPADVVHVDADGNVIDGFVYSYDANGRLASEGELTPGHAPSDPGSDPSGSPTPYTYDATSQLLGDGTNGYAYDANGNRTGTGIVTGPDNQILSDGTWDYSYDAEGNRTGKVSIADGTAWAYTYDNANRLASAVERDPSGAVVYELDLFYDVFGNLIQEVEPTSVPGVEFVTRYAYDGPNVRSDLDANNDVVTHYLTGDAVDAVFARESASGAVGWYLTDRLGSVRDIVDGTGSVLDHRDYDPFGNVIAETSPSQGDRYGFAGMTLIATVGVYYDRARDYDSFTGTFTTQDPDGFDARDANLYRYVVNSPTNGTDPSGLDRYWGQTLWELPGQLYGAIFGTTAESGVTYANSGFDVNQAFSLNETEKHPSIGYDLQMMEADSACKGPNVGMQGLPPSGAHTTERVNNLIATVEMEAAGSYGSVHSIQLGRPVSGRAMSVSGSAIQAPLIPRSIPNPVAAPKKGVAGTRPGGMSYWNTTATGTLDLHPVQTFAMTQIDETCGPSAVLAAIQEHGIPITKEIADQLHAAMRVNEMKGTRLDQLLPILKNAGVNAQIPKKLIGVDELEAFVGNSLTGYTAIVNVGKGTKLHTVLVEGFTLRNGKFVVQILDSNEGARFYVPTEEFLERFGKKGEAILLSP